MPFEHLRVLQSGDISAMTKHYVSLRGHHRFACWQSKGASATPGKVSRPPQPMLHIGVTCLRLVVEKSYQQTELGVPRASQSAFLPYSLSKSGMSAVTLLSMSRRRSPCGSLSEYCPCCQSTTETANLFTGPSPSSFEPPLSLSLEPSPMLSGLCCRVRSLSLVPSFNFLSSFCVYHTRPLD